MVRHGCILKSAAVCVPGFHQEEATPTKSRSQPPAASQNAAEIPKTVQNSTYPLLLARFLYTPRMRCCQLYLVNTIHSEKMYANLTKLG